jgi:hydrogenase maturation protease
MGAATGRPPECTTNQGEIGDAIGHGHGHGHGHDHGHGHVPRVLVAGIGNIFFGDDGFGVEVAQRLLRRPVRDGVTVRDFGIRGFDLTCALLGDFDAAILVDATRRGGPPGTLYVLEPPPDPPALAVEAHAIEPHRVLALARAMGGHVPSVRIVGCEPGALDDDGEIAVGLSARVEAAIEPAIALIESLVAEVAGA